MVIISSLNLTFLRVCLSCALPGTPLGDPIELGALKAALGNGTAGSEPRLPLTLSANKVLLGHTEGAAGIAGLLQVSCHNSLCVHS